jgi:hypothetical protein
MQVILLTNGGLLANTTALNPGIAFSWWNGVNALYGADLVLLGVMKSVLGLELGQILGFAALSFLIMLSLEGVFLLLLFRGKRGEERTRTELMAGQTTKELGAPKVQALQEPLSSVTDHTTCAFEPIYTNRNKAT